MKILYVIDSLASKGGAERIISEKMNYMADVYGFEVSVVTCYQNLAQQANAYDLSPSVRQVNLCIPYYSQYKYGYPFRLWKKWRLYRQLVNELTKAVCRLAPDVLVGLGYFQADVVMSVPCRAKKVVESHEARIFTMSGNGLSRSFLSRLYMRFYTARYFRRIESRADVVVTLTHGDAEEWRRAKRLEVIPNFTMMKPERLSSVQEKRVIAVGRLEWQKGFDRIIDIWKIVSVRHPEWRLDIFGSGTLEKVLNRQIADANLCNSLVIHPFTPTISHEYMQSSIFVLPSRFEGFGLVLLEAMSHGLPCVTFDCPFGPADVVEDGVCGYVVPDGDLSAFAEHLERLMSDIDLRRQFSQAAVLRSHHFDVVSVMAQWKSLFERLIKA